MKKANIDGIKLYRFEWDYINSNMYVIEVRNSVLVIDPVETKEVLDFWRDRENNVTNITVILTHEHFDHISGLNYLKNTWGCTVISSSLCSKNITDSKKNLSEYLKLMKEMKEDIGKAKISIRPFICKSADVIFEHEMKRIWMGHEVELIQTPGHTQGSICVIFDKKIMFTGDTLLKKTIITKLPGGSKKIYINNTRTRLLSFLRQVKIVCPGHGECDIASKFERFI